MLQVFTQSYSFLKTFFTLTYRKVSQMNISTEKIAYQALQLSQQSRAYLSMILLDSLDESDSKYDQNINKWLRIAQKRDQEISKGHVVCNLHDDVMKKAFQVVNNVSNNIPS